MKILGRGLVTTSFKVQQGFIELVYDSGNGTAESRVMPLSSLQKTWHQYNSALPTERVKIIVFVGKRNSGLHYINVEDAAFNGAACTPVVPNGTTIDGVFAILSPYIPLVTPSTPPPPIVQSAQSIVTVDDTTPTVSVPAGAKSITVNVFQDVKYQIGAGIPETLFAGQSMTATDMTNGLLYGITFTQIGAGVNAQISYLV
jgi:hypothetical protein